MKRSFVIAAGGTGGHFFPADALAHELKKRGHDVFIFTDTRGKTFHHADKDLHTIIIKAGHFQGSLFQKGTTLFHLFRGVIQAFRHLRKIKPAAIIGFGGYVTFPPLFAAWLLRIPSCVHQADALFGHANRFLSSFVDMAALSFEKVEGVSSSIKTVFTGLPVRSDIEAKTHIPYPARTPHDPFHLLVMGGSQGAKIFSEMIPRAIALLPPEDQKRLRICQQSRPEFLETTKTLYKNTQATVQLFPFIHDVADKMAWAHLVITRAGASTLAELSAMGRPALFIPYPFAKDDHQTINARVAENAKGGWLIPEKKLTPSSLAAFLETAIQSPSLLAEAGNSIKTIGRRQGALHLADLMESLGNRIKNQESRT